MYESNVYAYNMSKTFLRGVNVFPGMAFLSCGPGQQMISYAEITL